MKKIFSKWFAIAIAMLTSFTASAALTTTYTWDIPGSVEFYVGGSGASYKVEIPADATTYTAVIDNTFGSTYVKAAPGYFVSKGVASNGTEIKLNTYSMALKVDQKTYDGETVHIIAEKVDYDGELEINLINGRDYVTYSLEGMGRVDQKLKTGIDRIPYSTKYETGIKFTAKKDANSPVDWYIRQNGVEVEWKNSYGTLKMNNPLLFENGTNFEVKYSDTPDPEPLATAIVTLDFQNDLAKTALEMIFNKTQGKSISARDQFEVNVGDAVNFSFNTLDYTVTVNGEQVPAPTGINEYTVKGITFTKDATVSISAVERVFGTVDLTFYANTVDGLVFTEGTEGGEVVSADRIIATGATTNYTFGNGKAATLNEYTISGVSEKTPKVFVNAGYSHWIEASERGTGDAAQSSNLIDNNEPLHILVNEIVRDADLVVFVYVDKATASIDDVKLYDNRGISYPLVAGYNEFKIDPDFSSTFTPALMSDALVDEAPSFTVYMNGNAVALNDESQQYTCSVGGKSALMHLFAGATKSTKTITANIAASAASTSEVVVDRFHVLKDGQSVTTFTGCEVSVTPGDNKYLLDEEVPEFEGETHTFKASDNHVISIGDFTVMTVSPNNESVEEFTQFDVQFPNATTVVKNTDPNYPEEVIFYMSWEFETVALEGAAVPTFKIIPNNVPTTFGKYDFIIPAGYFIIDGETPSPEFKGSFNLTGDVNLDELISFEPGAANEIALGELWGFSMFAGGPEGYEYDVRIVNPDSFGGADSPVSLKMNGEAIAYGSHWTLVRETGMPNMVMCEITNKENIEAGTLFFHADEGTFTINGVPSPLINVTWTITEPTATYTVTPNGQAIEVFEGLTAKFEGATNVTLNTDESYGEEIMLVAAGNSWAAASFNVTAIEGQDAPAFLIVPNQIPTQMTSYSYTIPEGYFIIDGVKSAAVSGSFSIQREVVITEDDIYFIPESDVVALVNFYGVTVSFGVPYQSDYTVRGKSVESIKVTMDEQELVYGTDWTAEYNGSMFIAAVSQAFKETMTDCTFSIDIPAGALSINGTDNPAISHSWEVVANRTYEYALGATADGEFGNFQPADVAELAKIYIKFIGSKEIEVFNRNFISLRDGNYQYNVIPQVNIIEPTEEGAEPVAELVFNPAPKAAGSYTLTLNACAFVIDGAFDSPSVREKFQIVSSEINVEADANNKITVVSIDGRVLLRDAEPAEAETLAPGLYIINGSKRAIK